jgi:hypothetical protein
LIVDGRSSTQYRYSVPLSVILVTVKAGHAPADYE